MLELQRGGQADRARRSGCSCGRSPKAGSRCASFSRSTCPDGPLPHENDRETFLGRVIDGALNALNAWRENAQAAEALG